MLISERVPPPRLTQGRACDPTGDYVVSSDLRAFYQYVDHALLARKILSKAGDAIGVDVLTELLVATSGQAFGLPQQSAPSGVWAKTYIDVVERRLKRRELTLWRCNDDWRITTKKWSDAAVEAVCREGDLIRRGFDWELLMPRAVEQTQASEDAQSAIRLIHADYVTSEHQRATCRGTNHGAGCRPTLSDNPCRV